MYYNIVNAAEVKVAENLTLRAVYIKNFIQKDVNPFIECYAKLSAMIDGSEPVYIARNEIKIDGRKSLYEILVDWFDSDDFWKCFNAYFNSSPSYFKDVEIGEFRDNEVNYRCFFECLGKNCKNFRINILTENGLSDSGMSTVTISMNKDGALKSCGKNDIDDMKMDITSMKPYQMTESEIFDYAVGITKKRKL